MDVRMRGGEELKLRIKRGTDPAASRTNVVGGVLVLQAVRAVMSESAWRTARRPSRRPLYCFTENDTKCECYVSMWLAGKCF